MSTVCEGSSYMTSSLFDMVGLFDFGHSNGYVVVFICISPMAGDTDHLFTCYWPFVPLLLWQSFQSFAPLLLGCLIIELWEFCKFFVTYVSIFFPQTVVCLFLSCILWWAENFNINEIKFVTFFFLMNCSFCVLRNVAFFKFGVILPCFLLKVFLILLC